MSVKTRIDILVESVENSLILMIGESGTAKEDLTYRYIEDGLEKGETVLVVLFAHSTADFVETLKKKEIPADKYIKSGDLNFIDVISFRSRSFSPSIFWASPLPSERNFSAICFRSAIILPYTEFRTSST